MKIEGQEIGRVAVLVLDYDPRRDKSPGETIQTAYSFLNEKMKEKYPMSYLQSLNLTVLANEELVARHQSDLEAVGVRFLPNWRDSIEYRDLLREGLRQGNEIYVMDDYDHVMGRDINSQNTSTVLLMPSSEAGIDIIDPDGKIDIRPKNPMFPILYQ